MNFKLIFGLFLLLITSCSAPTEKVKKAVARVTDPNVKSQLQGVWLDKNTESPVLKIDGDSILYVSKSDLCMPYKLVDDTLFVTGLHTAAYPILEQSEHSLCFRTPMGDEMSLYKYEDSEITIEQIEAPRMEPVKEVVKKDSIIRLGDRRFRGYITINPTTIKVVRPGVTEDGFSIDNVYYDNIIHICVYEGKDQLCGKDIKRSMFEGVVPAEFLSYSILQDMAFMGKKDDNFLFRATLCVPDGPSFYARVLINEKNEIKVELII